MNLNIIKNKNPHEILDKISLRNVHMENVYKKTIPFVFNNVTYSFDCFIPNDDKNFLSIIYLNNEKNIISLTNSYNYDENFESIQIKNIDMDKKEYCIELLEKKISGSEKLELWINFIQNNNICNLPSMPETNCKKLGGIIKLIFNFLAYIEYNGNIFLEDHSQINTQFTLLPRLLNNNGSIYSKYGFMPFYKEHTDKEQNDELINEIRDTIITINNTEPYYKYLPIEIIKNFEKIELKNLIPYISNPNNDTIGKQNTQVFINLPKKIKDKFELIKKPYYKMINTNYRNFLNCEPEIQKEKQSGGYHYYKHKYNKYKLKYMKIKNLIEERHLEK
jgi:hypothetical protein